VLGQTEQSLTATPDGILRRPEVDPAFLGDAVWDGRGDYSYVPPPAPELRIPDDVLLHQEFDLGLGIGCIHAMDVFRPAHRDEPGLTEVRTR